MARVPRAIRGFGAAALVAVAGCGSSGDVGPQFSIAPDSVSLLVGQSIQLTAVNSPGSATWSTDNSAVATVVPQTGFVQAVGRGEASIMASTGSARATARIHVTVPPAIALSKPTVSFDVTVGDPDPASHTVTVTNGGDGTLGSVTIGGIAYGAGEVTGWLTATASGSSAPVTI